MINMLNVSLLCHPHPALHGNAKCIRRVKGRYEKERGDGTGREILKINMERGEYIYKVYST